MRSESPFSIPHPRHWKSCADAPKPIASKTAATRQRPATTKQMRMRTGCIGVLKRFVTLAARWFDFLINRIRRVTYWLIAQIVKRIPPQLPPEGRIPALPPIHKHELAANRSHNGLSPSPPLINGGAGRGEVALSYLASGAVSSCAPSGNTIRVLYPHPQIKKGGVRSARRSPASLPSSTLNLQSSSPFSGSSASPSHPSGHPTPLSA